MLTVTIPESEFFNSETNEFVYQKGITLQLEHSLISLSKWESKWHKPFLSKEKKTTEETIDYIRCMTITQNVPESAYFIIPQEVILQINKYIEDPMTATWFRNDTSKPSRETITSEIIYYWMVVQHIPFECQKWHLNRLLTLIRVCGVKNAPKKKRSQSEILREQSALNAERRKRLNSKG